MGDVLGFLLACFVLGLVVGTPVAVLVLFLRNRSLERRVAELADEVAELAEAGIRPAPAREAARAPAPAPRRAARPAEIEHEEPPEPERREPKPAEAGPPPARVEPERAARPAAPPAPAWTARLRGVDWERWIGVRGAAVVGGAVLALAAIFLFHHAFTHGWITPPMRVALGVAAGVGAIAAGMRLRGKGYAFTPAALEGAGVVALYATVWAADKRYHMLSMVASFPLMALVTALACALAVRHRALLTAVLGLVGGFATPLLLSTGEDRPLGLFGYVLLLDLGLVFVGKKRGWASIGLLALLGTFLLEGLWVFGPMGEERIGLGIAIVGLFAVVFTLAGGFVPAGERRRWLPAQAGGVIFPFVFAVYFSDQLEFRGHVWPNALLLGLLAIAGLLVGRLQRAPFLGHGSATAGVAVVAVWFFQIGADSAVCRELSAVALGLALIPHAFAEWERRRDGAPGPLASAAVLGTAAWAILLVVACPLAEDAPVTVLLPGLAGAGALLVRQAFLVGRGPLVLAAGLAVGLGLGLKYLTGDADDIDPRLFALVTLGLALALFAVGVRVRSGVARHAWTAGALLLAPFLLVLPAHAVEPGLEAWFAPTTALVLTLAIAAAAASASSTLTLALGAYLAFHVQLFWSMGFLVKPRSSDALATGFVIVLATAAVHVLWPAAWIRRFAARPGAFVVAALAAPAWALVLAPLYEERFGRGAILLPHLALAALALAAFWRARATHVRGGAPSEALPWLGGAASFLLAVGVAVQFEHGEFAVAAALWSLGLAAFARWLDHRDLAWVSIVAGLGATLGLVAGALDSGHYARSESLFLNVLSYVHLVPAAALAGVTALLRPLELRAANATRTRRLLGAAPGLGVVVIVFAWINLEILNFYGKEDLLSFDTERLPARDLATSLSWGVYALLLLGLGTWRRVQALRWASLALFFLAIGKVFLSDLGHLQGLYRVGSLAGLAISLIAVSLFYQRFVFRGGQGGAASDPTG